MMPSSTPTPTPGYEITRFEVNRFCSALGLEPTEVIGLQIVGKRIIATLRDVGAPAGVAHLRREIVIPIKDTRK